jgi:hypothetical protein
VRRILHIVESSNMAESKFATATLIISIVTALQACGSVDSTPQTTAQSELSRTFVDPLNKISLANVATLSSPAFQDAFDTTFLDSGTTKAQLTASFAAEVTAASALNALAFPIASLSNLQISNCATVSNGIECTLTADITNTDADTTTATFSTTVRKTDTWRVVGDKAAAAT